MTRVSRCAQLKMHKSELSLSWSYKWMPFCRYKIQKVLSRTIFKSERILHTVATDLYFLFQTIWLALRKSKQPTFHVHLPPDSIKSLVFAWHKHPNVLTWVTHINCRMKWIWMLPHQRRLVNKAPQMVRDEWLKHILQNVKRLRWSSVCLQLCRAALKVWSGSVNMTNAGCCCVWEHQPALGTVYDFFFQQWRPVFWITRMEFSWTSNNLFKWSIKPDPSRKAQS